MQIMDLCFWPSGQSIWFKCNHCNKLVIQGPWKVADDQDIRIRTNQNNILNQLEISENVAQEFDYWSKIGSEPIMRK